MSDFIVVMACFGMLIIFGCIWAVCLEILEDWRTEQNDKKRNMPLLSEEERRQMRAGGVRRER